MKTCRPGKNACQMPLISFREKTTSSPAKQKNNGEWQDGIAFPPHGKQALPERRLVCAPLQSRSSCVRQTDRFSARPRHALKGRLTQLSRIVFANPSKRRHCATFVGIRGTSQRAVPPSKTNELRIFRVEVYVMTARAEKSISTHHFKRNQTQRKAILRA